MQYHLPPVIPWYLRPITDWATIRQQLAEAAYMNDVPSYQATPERYQFRKWRPSLWPPRGTVEVNYFLPGGGYKSLGRFPN